MTTDVKVLNVVAVVNPHNPLYSPSSNGLTPTAATNIMVIETGLLKTVRIRRVLITPGTATAVGVATLTVSRNTVAFTAGGTTPTPAALKRDLGDPDFTGVIRVGAFTVVGVTTTPTGIVIPLVVSTTALVGGQPYVYDFTQNGRQKGIVVPPNPAGSFNGVMFQHSGLAGAASFSLMVEFTEE